MDKSYFENFTKLDYYSRQCRDRHSCLEFYNSQIQDFSSAEEAYLKKLTQELKTILSPYKKINSIKWKFYKTNGNIENGFPFTRQDVIYIPGQFFSWSKKKQLETLLHEKVHIFQRYNIDVTDKLMREYWHFKKIDDPKVIEKIQSLRRRFNPDATEGPQYFLKDQAYCYQEYNNPIPKSLVDSNLKCIETDTGRPTKFPLKLPTQITQKEHPFEIMAQMIADIIINKSPEYNNPYYNSLKIWMNKFF